MSASATQWNPPPAQMPLTAVMTGFQTCWCQAVKCRSKSSHRLPVALHADPVGGDLGHVDAGLEGPAVAGVDDDPHVGVGVQLLPGHGELVAHLGVHGVSRSGRLLMSQPTGPVALDDQRVEDVLDMMAAPQCSLFLSSSIAIHAARASRRSPGPSA